MELETCRVAAGLSYGTRSHKPGIEAGSGWMVQTDWGRVRFGGWQWGGRPFVPGTSQVLAAICDQALSRDPEPQSELA